MKNSLPKHIAIIMDGNRRWAEKRGLSKIEGHKMGADRAVDIVKYLDKKGIKYVTLYSFSTENWNRPPEEVKGLMEMLEEYVESESERMIKLGFRIRHIGRTDRLSPRLKKSIASAIIRTTGNPGITVNFAFDYGGRMEIVQAARQILSEKPRPESVNEECFSDHLYTAGIPDVDLLIRTGGELRLSNFLLWQAAYSELYFTEVLWPDFDRRQMARALTIFKQRQRRFGGD